MSEVRNPHRGSAHSWERKTGNLLSSGPCWAILLTGAFITLTDGLLRSANTEWELASQDPLQYQPYAAAYVFALIMLPLCLWYAKRYGLTNRLAVLLWFVLCTVTYTKDFAYIKVPGAPIFISDVVLLCLFYSARAWRRTSQWAQSASWVFRFLLAYFAVGVLELLRSRLTGADFLLGVRDFALVLYALFALAAYEIVDNRDAIVHLMRMFWLGAMLATVNAIGWFIVQPDQRRYVMYGAYIPAALMGSVLAGMSGLLSKRIAWSSSFLLGIGVLLQNARSSDVALVVAFAAALLLRAVAQGKVTLGLLKPLLAILLVPVFVIFIFSKTGVGAAFLERAAEEFVSGTVNYSEDDNAQFRFLAWAEALDRFQQQPVMGEGYGIPFTFANVDTDPRPHNTYLTVLYKMGVLGFLPFFLCLLALYGRSIRELRHRQAQLSDPNLLAILVSGHFLLALAGGVGLLLESPFLASIFWIAVGLQARLTSHPAAGEISVASPARLNHV